MGEQFASPPLYVYPIAMAAGFSVPALAVALALATLLPPAAVADAQADALKCQVG